jgi:hypothetical protein
MVKLELQDSSASALFTVPEQPGLQVRRDADAHLTLRVSPHRHAQLRRAPPAARFSVFGGPCLNDLPPAP